MKLLLKKHVRIEQSAAKIILIDDSKGDFYECNETTLLLLKVLMKGAARQAMVQILLETYDLSELDAHAQVDYCVNALLAMGMLSEEM